MIYLFFIMFDIFWVLGYWFTLCHAKKINTIYKTPAKQMAVLIGWPGVWVCEFILLFI